MSQTLLYKLILSIILISLIFPRHVKPSGNEKLYKLSGISSKSTRSYYLLDENGLSYSNLKRYVNNNNAVVKIISRSQIAPNSNSKKSFGFKLIIKKGKKTILSKELQYNKKSAKVTSPKDKKGFHFTEAGFWIEEVDVNEKIKIYVKPLDGSSDVFVRVVIEDSQNRNLKDSKKITTLNRKQNFSIKYENNEGKNIKSHNWYIVDDDNVQKFKLSGPSIIRVFTRYIYAEEQNSDMMIYPLVLYEDEKWMGEYSIIPEKSQQNAKFVNKDLDNYELGKYKSFYFNVPQGTHYYTIKIPSASNENKFLFKIEEYELK